MEIIENFDMDKPLLRLRSADGENVHWTSRHAVEGVQIFGGIGSGKTTGSGRAFALELLAAGFGGLVLTVKTDEKEQWEEYCKLAGRSQDLVIIEPKGGYTFNFLDYESGLDGKDTPTENIVEVMKTVIKAGDDKSGTSANDPFWDTALDMLIFNAVDLCKLADGRVSVKMLYDIVQSLPKDAAAAQRIVALGDGADPENAFEKAFFVADEKVNVMIARWELAHPEEVEALEGADRATYARTVARDVPEVAVMENLRAFFLETYAVLAENTRSIIDFSFSGFLFRLLREPIYSLFCDGESTILPEASIAGKIILLNLPVKQYHKAGRDIQVMFKYVWQRAMERRIVKEDKTLPVFLWADEAQNFLHPHDADFQATARSKRIVTVYLSQNLPNYHASMGGTKSDNKVKSFLGTLNTKVFHANSDIETNKYASELIGEGYMLEITDTSGFADKASMSRARSRKLQRMVRPEAFPLLRTGGPLNDRLSEAYMHVQGLKLKSGRNYLLASFLQDFGKNKASYTSKQDN